MYTIAVWIVMGPMIVFFGLPYAILAGSAVWNLVHHDQPAKKVEYQDGGYERFDGWAP